MLNIRLGQTFLTNLSQRRFLQHRTSIVNRDLNNANSAPPIAQAHILPSNINVTQITYQNSPLLIDMQSPSGTQQENPMATTSNVVSGLTTPVL